MKILNKIKQLGDSVANGICKVLGITLAEDKQNLFAGFIIAVGSLVLLTLLVNLFR